MNNASYWSKRFEALSDLEYRKSEKYLIELKQKIRRSELEIKKQLEAWYTRLADNNDISYAEARKLLKRNELKEFKWSVDEYIKYGRENALDGAWVKELENASAKVHVSRLEQIQIQLQNEVEKYYADYNKTAVNHLESIAEDSYYRTAYEISKGAGVGVSFAKLDADTLGKIVNRPWAADGKAFSDRIWTSKKEMVRTLTGELTRHVVAGTAPQKAVKVITDKFHVTESQAKRLVLTETAAIQSEASKASLSSIGVEKYKILATLDSRTSEICRELDGKTFKMTEYKVGITAPPFHCYCRSCTVPDISDDIVDELNLTRASRDNNDEGYITTTPANATYKEWKEEVSKEISKHENDKLAKAGINKLNGVFVNKNDLLYENAKKVKPLKNYEDFTCHCTGDFFQIETDGIIMEITPEEFADLIKNSNSYKGGNVRLLSCKAGMYDNGAAQRVANALGKKVLAPTETLNIDENGEMFITNSDILSKIWYTSSTEERSKIKQTGYWKTFKPKKG